ncbi:AlpA family transcriptional regulator [Bradyrhizobium sp. AUGA SZCCT0283]|uniref:helix-turn-helix transcriptional regulator n=1 Tax=Bradyrhizobium sp. AUGA SZCCT0283 TaxID=2807671 RepID=UPI001BAB803A|nr:hypothetical protein [Bradyrhizobium sp. AUGA SZCCT0283]MBR1275621.1 hypothetical protein [Bradyrhizobium sp. AUGA SZCCT0283]
MSNAEPILSQFLTKEELAAELGRNARTLDRWDALAIGPPRTFVGRKILYRRASLQRWLAAQENPSRKNTAAAKKSSARELRGGAL